MSLSCTHPHHLSQFHVTFYSSTLHTYPSDSLGMVVVLHMSSHCLLFGSTFSETCFIFLSCMAFLSWHETGMVNNDNGLEWDGQT